MNRAVELFTAVPRCHNCAQAVVDGCGYGELADEMKMCGGGNAPDNCCGALHAAMCAVGEDNADALRNDFVEILGSSKCRELKAALPAVPCVECVRVAAELLEKYGKC